MTVSEVKEEVLLLNLENIRKFPCGSSKQQDFYTLWSRFGPQAARDIMIPPIWNNEVPRPSEFFASK